MKNLYAIEAINVSKTFNKNNTLYEFKVSVCGKCKRNFNNLSEDWLKFNDDCNDYINEHFEYLFTS